MASMTVELSNIAGTEAALGWAGGHTLVVDRPEGRAGGKGLGFNGGQLLALTIGGCFANDLRYTAHANGIALGRIGISVTVELDGDPIIATGATMTVSVETLDGSDPAALIAKTERTSMAANSLRRGVPVTVRQG
jgi:organic hydroperoxide reductase OsmC/OhrA